MIPIGAIARSAFTLDNIPADQAELDRATRTNATETGIRVADPVARLFGFRGVRVNDSGSLVYATKDGGEVPRWAFWSLLALGGWLAVRK